MDRDLFYRFGFSSEMRVRHTCARERLIAMAVLILMGSSLSAYSAESRRIENTGSDARPATPLAMPKAPTGASTARLDSTVAANTGDSLFFGVPGATNRAPPHGDGTANPVIPLMSFLRLVIISGVVPLVVALIGLAILLLWSMRYGSDVPDSETDFRNESFLHANTAESRIGSMDDYDRSGEFTSDS